MAYAAISSGNECQASDGRRLNKEELMATDEKLDTIFRAMQHLNRNDLDDIAADIDMRLQADIIEKNNLVGMPIEEDDSIPFFIEVEIDTLNDREIVSIATDKIIRFFPADYNVEKTSVKLIDGLVYTVKMSYKDFKNLMNGGR